MSRYLLRKEMDSRANSDSMSKLGNLAMSIQGAVGGGDKEEDEDATDVEASVIKDEDANGGDPDLESSGPTSDLFTEIHGGEVKKLERKLEASEKEKSSLTRTLSERDQALDRARAEEQSRLATLAQLASLLAAVEELSAEQKKREAADGFVGALDKQVRKGFRNFNFILPFPLGNSPKGFQAATYLPRKSKK